MRAKYLLLIFSFTLFTALAFAQSHLKNGVWRGELKTKSGALIPFVFDVKQLGTKQQIFIHNAAERFKVTTIRQVGDSVFIRMPLFNSEFKLKLDAEGLKGAWIKHYGDSDASMDFHAEPGKAWRFFSEVSPTTYKLGGRWSAVFVDNGKADTTVGEFTQVGTRVTGTFLTTTGDDRFLEGTIKDNKLYLSTFDGGHAYTFISDITDNNNLSNGEYYAGSSSVSQWSAKRDPKAALPDAYALTKLKPGFTKIAFTFPDINGKKVSLSDARFKNKVVIIQFMGSWCPNCMDETNYFVNNYYKKYHAKGVEIIGLAYERTTDFAKSKTTLQQLKTRFNVPYPLLITGYTPAAGEPVKSIPQLANYMGFPTTIIIDKHGNVSKIHTGFSGPGTGKYYTEFIAEFEKLTDNLLAER